MVLRILELADTGKDNTNKVESYNENEQLLIRIKPKYEKGAFSGFLFLGRRRRSLLLGENWQ